MSLHYPGLCRAQLSYEYLHTNSTTHEFLFGALVELVDNSRDAGANTMDIYTVPMARFRGGHLLCFLDDGCGMSRQEAAGTITFGYSKKRLDQSMVGQYGNGLKSGAMRIGQDFILFTKKDRVLSCVFLSRTFHESEKIEEVIVPMPHFCADTRKPLSCSGEEQQRHDTEMRLILRYSPFRTMDEFLAQFDKIKGESGTLVIIYNLKLLDNGEPELDFKSDASDIKLADAEGSLVTVVPERRSLRAYLSVLYEAPRMKIYCQHKKIRTRRIAACLFKPKMFKFSSARFKARAEKDCDQAKEAWKRANERAAEAQSKYLEAQKERLTSADDIKRLRQISDRATEAKAEATYRKQVADANQKILKEPKQLTLIFGMNIERRNHDGVFVYNSGRLIKMYERCGIQVEGGVLGAGVIGIVDVPFQVLEPTHNKQDFADAREYQQLLRVMGEHLTQYWKDLDLASDTKVGGVVGFWRQYGYLSHKWEDPPAGDENFRKARAQAVMLSLQCDSCLKWRTVPYQAKYALQEYPDVWVCKDNPDTQFNKCTAPERKQVFPEGKLVRENVTVEKKRELLQKRIEEQQKQLKNMKNMRTVTSSKDLRKGAKATDDEEEEEEEEESEEEESEDEEEAGSSARGGKGKSATAAAKKPKTKAALRATQAKVKKAPPSEQEEESEEEESEEEQEKTPRGGRRPVPTPPSKTAAAAAAKKPIPPPPAKQPPKATPPAPIPPPRRGAADKAVKTFPSAAGNRAATTTARGVVANAASPSKASTSSGSTTAAAIALSNGTASRPAAGRRGRKSPSTEEEESEPEEQNGVVDSETTPNNNNRRVSAAADAAKRKRPNTPPPAPTSSGRATRSAFDKDTNAALERSRRSDVQKSAASTTVPTSGDDASDITTVGGGDKALQAKVAALEKQLADKDAIIEAQKADVEDLGSRLRKSLYYFLPPNWRLTKDEIGGLSKQQLQGVDLQEFFTAYEAGLKALVAEHKAAVDEAKRETQQVKGDLTQLRRDVIVFLRTLNPDLTVNPDFETNEVESMLQQFIAGQENA